MVPRHNGHRDDRRRATLPKREPSPGKNVSPLYKYLFKMYSNFIHFKNRFLISVLREATFD